MTYKVQTAIYDILKRIQSDLAVVKTDVAGLKTDVADIKARVGRLEDIAIKQRRDSAAMLVIMRATAGVFDHRPPRYALVHVFTYSARHPRPRTP